MEELAERIEEASGATAAQMELNKKRESEVWISVLSETVFLFWLKLYFRWGQNVFFVFGETVFSVQGGEDEEGLGGDQHPAGGHCAQSEEETPGLELILHFRIRQDGCPT